MKQNYSPQIITQLKNVLIVNDHAAVRKGLKSIVDKMSEFGLSDTAENGKVALEKMKQAPFDLVLLDLSMPVMDGTTTFYNIRRCFPNCKVIVVSMFDEKRQVLELYHAGIDGYMLIEAEEDEYNLAISQVFSGLKYFTPKIDKIINTYSVLTQSEQKSFIEFTLSHREVEVVNCIYNQMSASQIALKLNISEYTVNNHRSRIMKKLSADNSVGIIIQAIKKGIIKM